MGNRCCGCFVKLVNCWRGGAIGNKHRKPKKKKKQTGVKKPKFSGPPEQGCFSCWAPDAWHARAPLFTRRAVVSVLAIAERGCFKESNLHLARLPLELLCEILSYVADHNVIVRDYKSRVEPRVAGEHHMVNGMPWTPDVIAVGSDNTIVVGDNWARCVLILSPDGETVLKTLRAAGTDPFGGICGVAVTEEGYIAVADIDRSRVSMVKPTGELVHVLRAEHPNGVAILPHGIGVACGDSVMAAWNLGNKRGSFAWREERAKLNGNFSYGVAAGPHGKFAVTAESGSIWVFHDCHDAPCADKKDGKLCLEHRYMRHPDHAKPGCWEWEDNVRVPRSGMGLDSRLHYPQGVAFDAAGNLIVADTGHNRIVAMSPAFDMIRTWGNSYEGAEPGRFSQPGGVAVRRDGVVIVADTGNHRLQFL